MKNIFKGQILKFKNIKDSDEIEISYNNHKQTCKDLFYIEDKIEYKKKNRIFEKIKEINDEKQTNKIKNNKDFLINYKQVNVQKQTNKIKNNKDFVINSKQVNDQKQTNNIQNDDTILINSKQIIDKNHDECFIINNEKFKYKNYSVHNIDENENLLYVCYKRKIRERLTKGIFNTYEFQIMSIPNLYQTNELILEKEIYIVKNLLKCFKEYFDGKFLQINVEYNTSFDFSNISFYIDNCDYEIIENNNNKYFKILLLESVKNLTYVFQQTDLIFRFESNIRINHGIKYKIFNNSILLNIINKKENSVNLMLKNSAYLLSETNFILIPGLNNITVRFKQVDLTPSNIICVLIINDYHCFIKK